MISLAIGGNLRSAHKEATPEIDHLRKYALWHPKIPESELFLNERFFMGEDPLVPGYRPLHRTLFGGPDGSDLRSLTGISVTLFDNQPFSMKFFYNNERISRERLELGYHPSKVFWRTIIFPVDGPGGEIIEVVDVAVQYYADESLIVTLNRGYHDIIRYVKDAVHPKLTFSMLNCVSRFPQIVVDAVGFGTLRYPDQKKKRLRLKGLKLYHGQLSFGFMQRR